MSEKEVGPRVVPVTIRFLGCPSASAQGLAASVARMADESVVRSSEFAKNVADVFPTVREHQLILHVIDEGGVPKHPGLDVVVVNAAAERADIEAALAKSGESPLVLADLKIDEGRLGALGVPDKNRHRVVIADARAVIRVIKPYVLQLCRKLLEE